MIFLLAFNVQGKVLQTTLTRISAGRQVYGATFGGVACGVFFLFFKFMIVLWIPNFRVNNPLKDAID